MVTPWHVDVSLNRLDQVLIVPFNIPEIVNLAIFDLLKNSLLLFVKLSLVWKPDLVFRIQIFLQKRLKRSLLFLLNFETGHGGVLELQLFQMLLANVTLAVEVVLFFILIDALSCGWKPS